MKSDRLPLLRRLDQVAIAGITAFCVLVLAVHYLWPSGGRVLEFKHFEPGTIDFLVDVNQADWPELTLLPDVGETLARRIVQSREQDGPYHDTSDLLRVSGIGPKSLEKIKPYLLTLPGADAVANN